MVWRQGVRRGAISINNCIVYTQLIYVYRPLLLLLLLLLAPAPAPAFAFAFAFTPTPAPTPAFAFTPALAPLLPALAAARFALAQYTDPVRLLWAWALYGKITAAYTPTAQGKWWSQLVVGLAAMGPNKQRDQGHIGWIMETELGVELVNSE